MQREIFKDGHVGMEDPCFTHALTTKEITVSDRHYRGAALFADKFDRKEVMCPFCGDHGGEPTRQCYYEHAAKDCPHYLEWKKKPMPRQRRYLPTFSDLVDRLTISQQKAVFIPERKREYEEEMALIEHDLDLILEQGNVRLNAAAIRAIIVIMLTNRFIWENESKARQGGNEQDKLLKLTHSINGVRNTAKNALAAIVGGRHDYKIDCFAAELATEFGDWNVFGEQK